MIQIMNNDHYNQTPYWVELLDLVLQLYIAAQGLKKQILQAFLVLFNKNI